ncbi:MAG: hypothetical protein GF350_12845, partial [Chitinivibrionales bacterium]|nr:hypothetical protein [Chitinivibrionales bacterium]
MQGKAVCVFLITGSILCSAIAFPYEELAPKFDRKKSRAMVRKISKPTLANLDFAAYNANPVLFDPKKQKATGPESPATLKDLTFDGMLSDVSNSLKETPLTDKEKDHP